MKNKNYIHHAPYLRNSIAYEHNFWYTCVKWWYLQVFFFFFRNFDFWGCKWGKRWPKMMKNSVALHISGTIDHAIFILSFMVQLCKMMIFQVIFSIFSKFWFSGLLGGEKGKKWSKMTKNYVCLTPYLRNHTSCDIIYGTQ